MSQITLTESDITVASSHTEVDVDLKTDPRVQWLKDRILTFIGMDDQDLFYSMLDEENHRRQLATFVAAPLKPNEMNLEKRVFYISKIIVDKLIHEDKEFTEWSKSSFMSSEIW